MSAKDLRIIRNTAHERQRGLCFWCKQPMIIVTKANGKDFWNHPRKSTADHLVLKANGGPISLFNIVAACAECNYSRHEDAPMLTTETIELQKKYGLA